MRHRSVASIVLASAAFLALSGCVSANMFADSSADRTKAGSIAPSAAPAFPSYAMADFPMSSALQPNGDNAIPVDPDQVNAALTTLKDALSGNKGTLWAHIVDAQTGDTVLTFQASTPRTPASVTKTLTALTAHYHLDEAATLDTGVSLHEGDIYLWGSGDLLLGTEAPTREVNGRASLWTLAQRAAQQLTRHGLTAVTVHWAPQPFEGSSRLQAWTAQEVADFEGHVGAYAINSGLIAQTSTFVEDPEKDVAQEFAALLEAQGISVSLGAQRETPPQATEIARVHSATIGEQIRYMMANSDNTLADQLCRLSAQAAEQTTSYSGATTNLKNTLQSVGVDPSGISLQDCSGLSTENRIPPEALTDALRVAMRSDRADLRDLVRDLPWAAAQGTMSRRSFDGTAIGNVQGKTGSLAEVSSLVGVVRTAHGRELLYAVGVEGTDEGAAYFMRPAIDEFIQTLTTL